MLPAALSRTGTSNIPVTASLAQSATGLAVVHYSTLLGVAPGSAAAWALPASYGAAALIGLAWALILKIRRPDVYQTIGLGAHAASVQAGTAFAGRS